MLIQIMLCVICVALCGTAGCQAPEARGEPPAITNPDVTAIREILQGVSDAIETQEDRLRRLETQIEELRLRSLDLTPDTPEPTQPQQPQSEAQRILNEYNGRGWYIRGARGDVTHLRRHLTNHGVPAAGLETLTNAELERVHGAVHTQHDSAAMYQQTPTQPGGFVRIRNCPDGRCRVYRR